MGCERSCEEACHDRRQGQRLTLELTEAAVAQVKQLDGGDILWEGSTDRCEEGIRGDQNRRSSNGKEEAV